MLNDGGSVRIPCHKWGGPLYVKWGGGGLGVPCPKWRGVPYVKWGGESGGPQSKMGGVWEVGGQAVLGRQAL